MANVGVRDRVGAMRCDRLSSGLCVVLLLSGWAAWLSSPVYAQSDSVLSESVRRRFERSLNELARLAEEQERLLSEAGEELSEMRRLLSESERKRRQLERSLQGLRTELTSLEESNRSSQEESTRLRTALAESENALSSLEDSWTRYRRSMRRRLWIERGVAAGLIILSFLVGASM